MTAPTLKKKKAIGNWPILECLELTSDTVGFFFFRD